MSDFLKALENAQARPPGLDGVSFDPFSAQPDVPPLVAPAEGPAAFPEATKWDMVYNCQRFYIGRELQAVLEGGAKDFAERDESGEYRKVMQRVVSGEAIIIQRTQSVLVDGSVVLWLEWAERQAKAPQPPRETREHLTMDELLSPERVTKRSATADAESVVAPGTLSEPSTNDEPDW